MAGHLQNYLLIIEMEMMSIRESVSKEVFASVAEKHANLKTLIG